MNGVVKLKKPNITLIDVFLLNLSIPFRFCHEKATRKVPFNTNPMVWNDRYWSGTKVLLAMNGKAKTTCCR